VQESKRPQQQLLLTLATENRHKIKQRFQLDLQTRAMLKPLESRKYVPYQRTFTALKKQEPHAKIPRGINSPNRRLRRITSSEFRLANIT